MDESAHDDASPTRVPMEADVDASQDASKVTAPDRSSAMGGAAESIRGKPETSEFGKAESNPTPVASTELSGTVQSVSKRARGQHVVHLENGQIWQENFASRYFPVNPGDTVVIKKRRFGGYRLVTESGKGFRVERVQ